MNAAQAKSIPLDEFLQRLGHQPTRERTGELWYHSPFRNERTASFKITRNRLAWFDHAEGVGGNIIDLAMRLGDVTTVTEALTFVAGVVGSTGYKVPLLKPVPRVQTPSYSLISRQSFAVWRGRYMTKAAQYLQGERGIQPEHFKPYLWDVTYQGADGKRRYGFGLENLSGGYEIRRDGDWAKSSVGPKDVSVFLASREFAPWLAFYSLMDFGTFLTIDHPPIGAYNFLIVNGDGLVQKALDFLESIPAGHMTHYPHTDQSGQDAYHKMLDGTVSRGWTGGDRAHLYDGFKDWTDKRQHDLGLNQRPVQPQQNPGLSSNPKFTP